MKIPCFILVRKNSKGIKNKNLKKINQLNLVEITIQYLKRSKYLDDIVISTDDNTIANISNYNKCFTIYPRPKKLSSDFATSESALKHAIKIYEDKFGKVDIVTYVQVTEPFRPENILDQCIENLKKNKKIDSCFASFYQKKNFWIKKNKKLIRISPNKNKIKPRQLKSGVYREDTGVALATRAKFLRRGQRLGKNLSCIPYTNPIYSIDINTNDDLITARKLAKK